MPGVIKECFCQHDSNLGQRVNILKIGCDFGAIELNENDGFLVHSVDNPDALPPIEDRRQPIDRRRPVVTPAEFRAALAALGVSQGRHLRHVPEDPESVIRPCVNYSHKRKIIL